MIKWKAEYREHVANLSNRELYEEFLDTAGDSFNDEMAMPNDHFRFGECRTEFEYRLKTNGFLD